MRRVRRLPWPMAMYLSAPEATWPLRVLIEQCSLRAASAGVRRPSGGAATGGFAFCWRSPSGSSGSHDNRSPRLCAMKMRGAIGIYVISGDWVMRAAPTALHRSSPGPLFDSGGSGRSLSQQLARFCKSQHRARVYAQERSRVDYEEGRATPPPLSNCDTVGGHQALSDLGLGHREGSQAILTWAPGSREGRRDVFLASRFPKRRTGAVRSRLGLGKLGM